MLNLNANELAVSQRAKRTAAYTVGGGGVPALYSLLATLIFWMGQPSPFNNNSDDLLQLRSMLSALCVLALAGSVPGAAVASYAQREESVTKMFYSAMGGLVVGAFIADAIAFISILMCELAQNSSGSSGSDNFALHQGESFGACAKNPALMFACIGAFAGMAIANGDRVAWFYGIMRNSFKNLMQRNTAHSETNSNPVARIENALNAF